MARLTIQDLAAVLIEKNDLSEDEALKFVTAVFDVIQEGIEREKLVKVKGLGTFKVIDVEARESVNVNTGERLVIGSHAKISFLPDTTMKELVNKPFSGFETVVLNEGVEFSDISDQEQNNGSQDEEETSDVFIEKEIPDADIFDEKAPEQPQSPDIPVGVPPAEEVPTGEEPAEEKPDHEAPHEEVAPLEVVLAEETLVEGTPVEDTPDGEAPVGELLVGEAPDDDNPDEGTPAGETTDEESPVEDASTAESASEEDPVAEEPQGNWSWMGWLLLALLACGLSFAAGYYLGGRQLQTEEPAQPLVFAEKDSAVVVRNDSVPERNDTVAEKKDSVAETKVPVAEKKVSVAEKKDTLKPVLTARKVPELKTKEEDWAKSIEEANKKYEAMDSRIRTGAYYIVGTKEVVTVREGDTLLKIARRSVGPELLCYIEAYNGIKATDALKVGQKIKIPDLKWKKNIKKKNKQ